MKILITGATGFVGRHLCEKLLQNNVCVCGTVRNANQAKYLPSGTQVALIDSIEMNTDWSEALEGIDTIIHLAARVHVTSETSGDPLDSYRQVNVAGTERLARQATEKNVRRIVFLSSVKVHGEKSSFPLSEKIKSTPSDPYGISKMEAELSLQRIAAETGLEVVIIRPPLVYGPGVKANFLNLMKIVERRIPLPLASIQNKRSLVYLGNLIDAIITCAKHPRAAGQTFLVSDDYDVSTPELIRMMAKEFELPMRLLPFSPPLMRLVGKLCGKTAAMNRLLGSLTVDIGKIRRDLNWQPPFTMAEGLKETADWYKSIKARSN